ncbi:MAG: transposase family protein [Planctomycetes bacterium]|nr:transposase family protein [Planctomycetota bacterium]
MVKNTLITTAWKLILFLGYSVVGSQHDYRMFKEEFAVDEAWFETFKLWVDLGYLGIRKSYAAMHISIPHKKPRKSKANPNPSLTDEQKAENREISRVRVVVEHAIGGMKRFAILVNTFRNRKAQFVDTVALLGAGLWNLKVSRKVA